MTIRQLKASFRGLFYSLVVLLAVHPHQVLADEMFIPLAGTWRFELDAKGVGLQEKWQTRALNDQLRLPGTTDENQKGKQLDDRPTDRLVVDRPRLVSTRGDDSRFLGGQAGHAVFRAHQEFQGVGGPDIRRQGGHSQRSPEFDVTKTLSPGKHTITMLIDNAKLPPVGTSHAVDERIPPDANRRSAT